MPAHKPEEIHDLFAQALTARDVDAVIALYEPDAILAPPQSDQVIQGRQAIRAALASYLAKKPQFTLLSRKVIRSDDIALLYSSWRISETDPRGEIVEYEVNPTLVARRQPDGAWLIVIDSPAGGA